MLKLFRVNDPYKLLWFFLVLIAVSLPFIIDPIEAISAELKNFVLGEALTEGKIMYVQIYDHTPPLASAVFGLINWIFGRSLLAWHLITLLIIFLQASYFAFFLIDIKGGSKEKTYLTALIFGILSIFSFDLITLSAELLGAWMLLMVLKRLLSITTSKTPQDTIILQIGICVGVATLIVFFYWPFLFAALLVLMMLIRMTLRKTLLLIFGFLFPHLVLVIIYYYWGNHGLLWENFYLSNLTLTTKILMPLHSIIPLGAFPVLYFMFFVLGVISSTQLNKHRFNILKVIFIWLCFAILYIFLSPVLSPYSFIVFIPPLSYFISYGLLLIKRGWLAELALWFFLIGVLGVGLSSRYGRIEAVEYSGLFPKPTPYSTQIKNKKILILGHQEGLYQHNTLGGFFLNWNLSRTLFEPPLSYDHIDKIALCFASDPPEVIVDEKNLMQNVIEKIPALKQKYKREGNIYKLN